MEIVIDLLEVRRLSNSQRDPRFYMGGCGREKNTILLKSPKTERPSKASRLVPILAELRPVSKSNLIWQELVDFTFSQS